MKKLFLTALFAVSGFAFAHCGTCGVGDEKKKACDQSECASDDHHTSEKDDSAQTEDSQVETESSQ